MLQIGQKAPSFTTVDSAKNKVSLEDFKGKNVLLLFYPAAFTGVCTKELCSTRDELSYYENLNVQILAISVDGIFTLAKFKELNNYNFPLLCDFNKEVSAAYGVLYAEWNFMKGIAKRSAFVIDKEGTIRYAEIKEMAGDLPDFDTIKKTLETI